MKVFLKSFPFLVFFGISFSVNAEAANIYEKVQALQYVRVYRMYDPRSDLYRVVHDTLASQLELSPSSLGSGSDTTRIAEPSPEEIQNAINTIKSIPTWRGDLVAIISLESLEEALSKKEGSTPSIP